MLTLVTFACCALHIIMTATSAGRPGTANIERDGKGSRASETLTILLCKEADSGIVNWYCPLCYRGARARHPIVDFLLRGDIIILCHVREP